MGGEHVVRRGEPCRPSPRIFEQRPTTKLDSAQLQQLLASPEQLSHGELEAEIEIVTPRLDDILPTVVVPLQVASGSLVEISVPLTSAEPPAAPRMTRWPVMVFALLAAAWIACSVAGL